MARKKEYEEYGKPFIEDIKKWRAQGLTDTQIYKKLNVGRTLACKWKNEFKDFETAFKNGEEELKTDLKHSLYQRAKGYYVEDIDYEYIYDRDGNKIPSKEKVKKRFIWSDKALYMALNHLEPGKWNDKQEEDKNEHTEAILKLAESMRGIK